MSEFNARFPTTWTNWDDRESNGSSDSGIFMGFLWERCVSVKKKAWRANDCVNDSFRCVCELSNVTNATYGLGLNDQPGGVRTRHYVRQPGAVMPGALLLAETSAVTFVGCAAKCSKQDNCTTFCHRSASADCRLYAGLSHVQAAYGWTTYIMED
ncbi:hypothetical protein LSAT2_021179 [Lamellibrachia satsuma]|nr:hypothetical protein LSAT2_021179 [Lamellibrachia satsuma]